LLPDGIEKQLNELHRSETNNDVSVKKSTFELLFFENLDTDQNSNEHYVKLFSLLSFIKVVGFLTLYS